MHFAFRGTAFSKSSKDIDRILGYLMREQGKGNLPVKHSLLLKRNSHYLNATEFKEVINTLVEQGDVEVITIKGTKGLLYDLKEKVND